MCKQNLCHKKKKVQMNLIVFKLRQWCFSHLLFSKWISVTDCFNMNSITSFDISFKSLWDRRELSFEYWFVLSCHWFCCVSISRKEYHLTCLFIRKISIVVWWNNKFFSYIFSITFIWQNTKKLIHEYFPICFQIKVRMKITW